jgi:ABC-type transport system involved in multi-copper enzyme maturation permease subunit
MIKNELVKMLNRKSVKIFSFLYVLVLIVITAGYFVGENIMGLSVFGGGQFISVSLGLMMSFLLPFMAIYLISTSISIDLHEGTIKNMFLLPVKKSKILFNKLLAIQLLISAVLAIHFIYVLIISLIQDGGFSIGLLGSYLLTYLGAIVVLGLVSIIGANIVLLVNSVSLTLIISYLSYIAIVIASRYFAGINAISISRILNNYENVFQLININLLLTISSYYILLLITSSLIFDKKEESVCQYE